MPPLTEKNDTAVFDYTYWLTGPSSTISTEKK